MTLEIPVRAEWVKILSGSFLVAVGFFFMFEAFDDIEKWNVYKENQKIHQEYNKAEHEYQQLLQQRRQEYEQELQELTRQYEQKLQEYELSEALERRRQYDKKLKAEHVADSHTRRESRLFPYYPPEPYWYVKPSPPSLDSYRPLPTLRRDKDGNEMK